MLNPKFIFSAVYLDWLPIAFCFFFFHDCNIGLVIECREIPFFQYVGEKQDSHLDAQVGFLPYLHS